jgi:hypothetical protein
MEGVQFVPLAKHRPDPKSGHAKILQIRKLGLNPGQRSPLPTATSGVGPFLPTVAHPRRFFIIPVKQDPGGFFAVAKTIRQQEINYLALPIVTWGRENRPRRRQLLSANALWRSPRPEPVHESKV